MSSLRGSARAQLPIQTVELASPRGLRVRLSNYGARILEFWCPDRQGKFADVVLGFDTVNEYARHADLFLGCTVGRVANRIRNARFELGGETYGLVANDGQNHLHGGGRNRFDRRVWEVDRLRSDNAVRFRLFSPHLEEGYPGNVDVDVTFTVTDDGLMIDYRASSDRATPLNLTNHTYWNLDPGSPDILDHDLGLASGRYTPVDDGLIPTGEIAPVEGTPLDFRKARPIRALVSDLERVATRGYDHNFVLDEPSGPGEGPVPVAVLHAGRSGRTLEVLSTQPAVQVYGGQLLPQLPGKRGTRLGPNAGICLEPQGFPNAVNTPSFPTVVVQPGGGYRATQVFRCRVDS